MSDELNAAAPRAIPRRVSPSALDRYRRCPRSFLLCDVERWPRTEIPSPTLTQANAIHHALERFFGLPRDDRTVEALHKALRWAWPQHRSSETFASREQEIEFGRSALEMLSNFYETFDTSAIPVARERWVSAELASGVAVFGKVDRVDECGDGLSVVDYKTGRHQIDSLDLRDESAVMVYVAGAEAVFGLPVSRVRFLYLASGEEAIWEPEREDIQEMRERLNGLLAQAACETDWAPWPGPHCRWCPVALRCDAREQVQLEDLVVSGEVVGF